jgi:hypothetical protein
MFGNTRVLHESVDACMCTHQIKLYLSNVPNITSVDLTFEMLTHKPLTNSAVQEELRKYLPNQFK